VPIVVFVRLKLAKFWECRYLHVQGNLLGGIGGSSEVFIYELTIDIERGTYRLPAQVGFGQFEFHGFSFILGQKDFFEHVDILFQRRKETIELILHLNKTMI